MVFTREYEVDTMILLFQTLQWVQKVESLEFSVESQLKVES